MFYENWVYGLGKDDRDFDDYNFYVYVSLVFVIVISFVFDVNKIGDVISKF